MSGCTYVYHRQLALQNLFFLAGRTNGSLTVTVLAVQGWIHLALHGIHGGWERRPESTDGTLEKSFCIKTSDLLQKQGERRHSAACSAFATHIVIGIQGCAVSGGPRWPLSSTWPCDLSGPLFDHGSQIGSVV